ncbi:PREDICTED: uncharacterized protein LOC106816144 [Priapulus caudatus]|uniref:Uncharacterized protein LOC106816144 n=1 Tax=Priapulus caudatus TaxID=37621 RepID=A0ABM1EVG5_PRICU|nr:PREDICTED: uncharacterized protein LOC106816144 [Priapulus caudatus]
MLYFVAGTADPTQALLAGRRRVAELELYDQGDDSSTNQRFDPYFLAQQLDSEHEIGDNIELIPDEEQAEEPFTTNCNGMWSAPAGCVRDDCKYRATWRYDAESDMIRFVLRQRMTDPEWMAIGFSRDKKMVADVRMSCMDGWNRESGKVVVRDGFLFKYAPAVRDTRDDIVGISGRHEDGMTTLEFSRRRDTGDAMDLAFTDDDCLYMLHPVATNRYVPAMEHMLRHRRTPLVSDAPVCVRACAAAAFVGSSNNIGDSAILVRPDETDVGVRTDGTDGGVFGKPFFVDSRDGGVQTRVPFNPFAPAGGTDDGTVIMAFDPYGEHEHGGHGDHTDHYRNHQEYPMNQEGENGGRRPTDGGNVGPGVADGRGPSQNGRPEPGTRGDSFPGDGRGPFPNGGRQPETGDGQGPIQNGRRQPGTDNGQGPFPNGGRPTGTGDGQGPFPNGGRPTGTGDGQEPFQNGGRQPETGDGQGPFQNGGRQPETGDGQGPFPNGGRQPELWPNRKLGIGQGLYPDMVEGQQELGMDKEPFQNGGRQPETGDGRGTFPAYGTKTTRTLGMD